MPSPKDIESGLGSGESVMMPNPPQPPHSELEIFQTLVGIRFLARGGGHLQLDKAERKKWGFSEPGSPLADIFRPSKLRHQRFRNRGLYDRALSQELKNRTLYTLSHYIISGLYLLQILLAATFTALSAYERISNIPLTVLGAMNTIIAGLLAWLTGQGMPVRFRAARDQYRELVKDIEATERLFSEIDYYPWDQENRPNPIRERNRLEQVYKDVLADQQANYPEAHNTPTADRRKEENDELRAKNAKGKAKRKEEGKATEMAFSQLSSRLRTVNTATGVSEGMRTGDDKADLDKFIGNLPEGSELRKRLEKLAAE